ncbi:MAG: hypothetical protein JWR41_2702, partial [Modestobacter sp.]|nr:hypothetical protein [Modestobacter sp.]
GRLAPEPPLPTARAGGGRRLEPAGRPTGEVSSWGGTQWALPRVVGGRGGAWAPQDDVFSCVPAAAQRPAARQGAGPGYYSVAARRRFLRGARPGVGSAPSTYEDTRWFQPQPRQTSTV